MLPRKVMKAVRGSVLEKEATKKSLRGDVFQLATFVTLETRVILRWLFVFWKDPVMGFGQQALMVGPFLYYSFLAVHVCLLKTMT